MRIARAVLRVFWAPSSPEEGREALRELRAITIRGVLFVVWVVVVIWGLSWWIYGPWAVFGAWLDGWLPGGGTMHFGIADSTWAYILGLTFGAIIVGLIAAGLISEARLRRRLRIHEPDTFAEVEAERAAYWNAQEQTAYRRELDTHVTLHRIISRRESIWSDVSRFLTFWRHRIR